MLKATKSQTINGGSYITENEVEVQIASMYASLDNRGNRSESVQILNQALYEANTEDVEADIAEFKRMANDLTNGGTQNELADNGI